MELINELKKLINDENHTCDCGANLKSINYRFHLNNCPRGLWLWMLYPNGKND